MSDLPTILARLGRYLDGSDHGRLRAPASEQQLRALRSHFFASEELPADLACLLTWHDGQECGGVVSPGSLWRLLPADEMVTHARRMSTKDGWEATWLPLASNDADDYWVYDTERGNLGRCGEFFHMHPYDGEGNEPLGRFLRLWVLRDWGEDDPDSGLDLDLRDWRDK